MLLETFEAGEALGVLELFVNEQAGEALFERPLGDLGVETFFAADERGQQGDRAFLEMAADGVLDGG